MADDHTLGARLRDKRREHSITQEQLAALSGVSQVMIAKIEQGRRQPRLPVLLQLAEALDVPLSELVDKRPRLAGHTEGASILAVRDALLSPSLLAGAELLDTAETTPVPELRAAVAAAGRLYWSGDFAKLAARLPILIAAARQTAQEAGPAGNGLLAQAYDLAAALMVHMGKDDLAAIGAERAITAARASGDEFLYAILHGTYAWVMLHQGRLADAEHLAVTAADSIDPKFSASPVQIAAWGNLLMTALAPAAAGGRDFAGFISLATAAAERLDTPTRTYLGQSPFGRTSVAMQACHAYAVTRQPGPALAAARKVDPADLSAISHGRHLLDVAQAHADARHSAPAVAALTQARALSPLWFRHQGIARSLITDLHEHEKRVSPALRDLAASLDPRWYSPYYRRQK